MVCPKCKGEKKIICEFIPSTKVNFKFSQMYNNKYESTCSYCNSSGKVSKFKEIIKIIKQ